MVYLKDNYDSLYMLESIPENSTYSSMLEITEEEYNNLVNNNILSLDDFKTFYSDIVQEILDNKAKEYRWDDMNSARAANVPIKDTDNNIIIAMKQNAEALTDWYFNIWATVAELEYKVLNNIIPLPTIEEIHNLLPQFQG